MTYRTEFPDYPPADMPEMPLGFGFEDNSWRNDACPCFASQSKRLMVWVDYADPAQRELDGPRFTLMTTGPDGDPGDELLSTDDWSAILSKIASATVAA